jgi:hypothetical protein
VKRRPPRDTRALPLASVLVALFLNGAATSFAQADSAETSRLRGPFASATLPDAASSIADDSMYSIPIEVSPNPTQEERVTITLSGAAEVASTLFVYVGAGEVCGSEPADSGGEQLSGSDGEAVGEGSFEKSYTYTPESVGSYTVCAFVDEAEDGTPNATGTASFTSITPPAVAEAREHAARAKAEEEQRAKERYEAEASAREAAARAAREAATRASTERIEAELAAEKAARIKNARSRPVARLTVTAVGHKGYTSERPGYTDLDVTTSPYAFVIVKLSRYRRKTMHLEWGDRPSAVAAEIPWSCHSPGGTYGYTVTAWTDVGKKLVKGGHFAPVSVARCHRLEHEEALAGERRQAEARELSALEYDEEVARRGRAQREEQEREESSCRQGGGTPTIVVLREGPGWVCEGPNGEALPIS